MEALDPSNLMLNYLPNPQQKAKLLFPTSRIATKISVLLNTSLEFHRSNVMRLDVKAAAPVCKKRRPREILEPLPL